MKLINKTTGHIISNQLKVASSWVEASLGLLNQPKGTAMLFNTRWGIHTFGMKYPIDIIILDQKLKVVQIKHQLQPNRIFFWNPKYSCIIEMAFKSKKKISLGDKIKY